MTGQRELDALRGRPLNLDLARREEYTAENGWHTDDVRRALPSKPPGEPHARRKLEQLRPATARDYDFAEPSIVEGIFDRARPSRSRTARCS